MINLLKIKINLTNINILLFRFLKFLKTFNYKILIL